MSENSRHYYTLVRLKGGYYSKNVPVTELNSATPHEPTKIEDQDINTDDYDDVAYDEDEIINENVGGMWRQDLTNFDSSEFSYPLTSKTRKVMGQSLIRFGIEWKFDISTEDVLKQFYHRL